MYLVYECFLLRSQTGSQGASLCSNDSPPLPRRPELGKPPGSLLRSPRPLKWGQLCGVQSNALWKNRIAVSIVSSHNNNNNKY